MLLGLWSLVFQHKLIQISVDSLFHTQWNYSKHIWNFSRLLSKFMYHEISKMKNSSLLNKWIQSFLLRYKGFMAAIVEQNMPFLRCFIDRQDIASLVICAFSSMRFGLLVYIPQSTITPFAHCTKFCFMVFIKEHSYYQLTISHTPVCSEILVFNTYFL